MILTRHVRDQVTRVTSNTRSKPGNVHSRSIRHSPLEAWTRIQSKIARASYSIASREPEDKGYAAIWEQVVDAYKAILNVFTREAAPKQWVEVQFNFAITLLAALEVSNKVDARCVSAMFLDIVDCCASSMTANGPHQQYAGLSMLGSAQALLKISETHRKHELVWAQLDSASKMLWQFESSNKAATIVNRTTTVTGLINAGTLHCTRGANS